MIIFFLQSCGPSQDEYDALKKKNEKLKAELDECRHGAEKLHSQMKIAFEKENFVECKSIYSEMEKRHPESEYFEKVKSIYDKVVEIQEKRAEQARIEAKRKRKEKLKALNKLRKDHDDVSGITWYKNPYFTHYNNTNLTSLYIGDKNNNRWLRLKMSYSGDDWIFFKKAYLSYEGNTKEVPFDDYDDKETDNGSGGVWEWIDVSVSSDLESFLRDFAKSSQAKMRLKGKYTRTRRLTWKERQGILDVLNGYDALEDGIK